MISILQNRPAQAELRLAKLEKIYGRGSWASIYRSAVLLADWKSCATARVADSANSKKSTEIQLTLLEVFRDLGRTFCFDFRGPIGLTTNLPKAIEQISEKLQ